MGARRGLDDRDAGERAERAGGRIAFRFHARDVNLVMGPRARGASVPFRVLVDGEPPGDAHGLDVDERGHGTLAEQRLYQLVRQPGPIADRTFEITFLDARRRGLRVHVRLDTPGLFDPGGRPVMHVLGIPA